MINIESGIRIIFGKFGKGKGTLNTMLACMEMKDPNLYEYTLERIAYLNEKLGRNFTPPPQNHVVFSNYSIKDGDFTSFAFDPDSFMLPNHEVPYQLYCPGARFHIEEGQSGAFSCYDWYDFPKPALLALSRVRHARYLFTIDLQFITNLNKNIRKFSFEYLTPLNLEFKDNCLNVRTESKCVVGVFYDYEKAVKFETTQDIELCDEFREYIHNGDIFNCFDSFGKEIEFFEAPSDKDLCYDVAKLKNIDTNKVVSIVI